MRRKNKRDRAITEKGREEKRDMQNKEGRAKEKKIHGDKGSGIEDKKNVVK